MTVIKYTDYEHWRYMEQRVIQDYVQ